ncbi:PPC domain-containing protein, partial [Candidatus Bipolaricaulota bacterium]|nr:PPC domain-containing protein [Candidatus Bipolaricaulota bacterium]
LNSGWYWLRDQALQQVAEWTFEGIPAGAEDLTLEITTLATNRGSGGRGFPAEFRLIYGFPGSGMMGGLFETKMVTLPNVSPPNDPLGYTCRGVVTISRSAFPAASTLVFKVERTSSDANHIAFNKESIVLLAPSAEHETEEQNDAGSGQDASDERQGAWPLRPGTYSGFLKHADDYDWYKIEIMEGQIISLKLVPQTGDFDLYLYRGDSGSSVAHSNHGAGQEEAIQYVAGQSGTWYIKVKRSSGEGPYDLTIEVQNQDDAGSGQDASDEREGACRLVLVPDTYSGFLKQADDYDWYKIELMEGQIISLKLTPQTGDFDLYLYKGDSHSSVAHSNHGTGQEEAIQYVAGQSGTWYIRVKRSSGEGEYTLTVAPPSYQASKFDSTGDLIDTW